MSRPSASSSSSSTLSGYTHSSSEWFLRETQIVSGQHGKRWKVIQPLGSGTCCEVYKVALLGERTSAALKVYNVGPGYKGAHDRERFILNLSFKSRQRCQQLVKTYDDFVFSNHLCLVQELLDCNLRQIILKNNGEGLSILMIQRLMKDLLKGVEHLHSVGFVHGDLKPTNIMWSPQDGTLKIIDLGLSFHKEDRDIGKLQSNGYRAPEVETWNQYKENVQIRKGKVKASNKANYDPDRPPAPSAACDIWSLGCIVGELFIGRRLLMHVDTCKFDGTEEDINHSQMLARQLICTRDFDKEVVNAKEFISSLQDFAYECLSSDPQIRPNIQQAKEFSFLKQEMHTNELSFSDLLLLPTCILRLLNVLDDSPEESEEDFEDTAADIREGCAEFGAIKSIEIPTSGRGKGKIFVEYQHAEDSLSALTGLSKKTFNGRTVLATYFPVADFKEKKLY